MGAAGRWPRVAEGVPWVTSASQESSSETGDASLGNLESSDRPAEK